MPDDVTPQQRLGALLRERRVDLDRKHWRNRRRFAQDTGIPDYIAFRVEQGLQANFRTDTKTVIELAYGLAPGSLDRSLASGELELADPDQPDAAPVDENQAYIARMLPKLDKAQQAVIASLIASWFSPPAAVPAAADGGRRTA